MNSQDQAPFDLIYIALEPWDEVWRRNQPLCAQLARSGAARRIVYVEPPRVVPYWLVRPQARRDDWARRGLRAAKGRGGGAIEGIRVFAPLQILPNTFAPLRAFNQWHERRQLRSIARRARLKNPTLYTNSHWAAPLAGTLGERGLVYDIGDDWLAVPDKRRARIEAGDALLCRRAGVTIVVSPRLRELKTPLSSRVELVPNGVDVEHYQSALDVAPHPFAARWRAPVLGYLGSIHAERVDLSLIEALSKALPDATIALVGPVLLNEKDRARIGQLANVEMPGAVSFEQAPAVLRAFDVFLVPHVESDFTRSLNPLKAGRIPLDWQADCLDARRRIRRTRRNARHRWHAFVSSGERRRRVRARMPRRFGRSGIKPSGRARRAPPIGAHYGLGRARRAHRRTGARGARNRETARRSETARLAIQVAN